MSSFVRLDNHIIRRRADGIASLDDVGLYALLSAFLSIPGFRTPSGGLHAAVAKHCSNGRHTLCAAWKRLSEQGYLKRTRLPDEHLCLRDVYTLHTTPDRSSPSVNHLSFAAARRVWKQPSPFLPPTINYTPVSTAVLMDARLSLSAKGLYAMIRQRLLLSSRVFGVTLTRESLRRSSGLGECAFRRIWKELRETGYLSLTHVWDAEKKQMRYHYDLAEALPALQETASAAEVSELPAAADTFSALPSLKEAVAPVHTPPAEQKELGDAIRDQIEYDVLLTRDNPPPLLDCTVEVMTRVLSLPAASTLTIRGAVYPTPEVQRTLAALDANEAEFAIQSAKAAIDTAATQGNSIRNLRGYLLSCLFSAKTDFAMSLIY